MFTFKNMFHILVCPISLLLLVSCSSEKNEVVEKEVARPVKLITTEVANELRVRRYPAAVRAALSRELSFKKIHYRSVTDY